MDDTGGENLPKSWSLEKFWGCNEDGEFPQIMISGTNHAWMEMRDSKFYLLVYIFENNPNLNKIWTMRDLPLIYDLRGINDDWMKMKHIRIGPSLREFGNKMKYLPIVYDLWENCT